MSDGTATTANALPKWLPLATRHYLHHIAWGQSIRHIARVDANAASTVLRQVRRIEARRDDPLLDEALSTLTKFLEYPLHKAAAASGEASANSPSPEETPMDATLLRPALADEKTINKEGRRILRRLCETGALLVLANDMEKAVVLRPGPAGEQTRTAVVDRSIAGAFVLKEWIKADAVGRLSKYSITQTGRSALKRLIEDDRQRRQSADRRPGAGFSEAQSAFQAQHREWGDRLIRDEQGTPKKTRVNLAESPLAGLARRKGVDGKPFLSAGLVQVGEKLREDFERAQMGPRVGQNWDRFLTGVDRGGFLNDSGLAEGPREARNRVSAALDELGPGLADVVLRVCCFLEGLESAEKRLGWSARSGKIVLKIGLQRLAKHYQDAYGFQPAEAL
ncbi:MAG: DUF6456 domain-containing protein [Pseudomonadota bacterium]